MIKFKNAVSPVTEWLESLTFNHKALCSNLSQPDERSKRETSRKIGFYSVHLVRRPTLISLYVHVLFMILGMYLIYCHVATLQSDRSPSRETSYLHLWRKRFSKPHIHLSTFPVSPKQTIDSDTLPKSTVEAA